MATKANSVVHGTLNEEEQTMQSTPIMDHRST